MQDIKHPTRDCHPSTVPLKSSYFHGTCSEPLSGETIGEVLRAAAQENPDHVIFRTYEFQDSLTLRNLQERADVASRALLAAGLKSGDVILLVGVTDIEYFVLYFAVTQIGMRFYYPTIDIPYDKEMLNLCNTEPAAVFVGRAFPSEAVPVLQEYVKSSVNSIPAVAVNNQAMNSEPMIIQYNNFLDDGKAITEETFQKALNAVSIDDIAVLFASSGTSSSKDKIACVTHHFIVNMAKFSYQRVLPEKTKEVIGFLNPMVDDAGCVLQLVRCVYNRVVGVAGPPDMTPSPSSVEIFMTFIEKEQITWYGGLPFELIHCLKSPARSKYDLSSLRGGNMLGQVTSDQTKQELIRIFPNMATIFGSTEALAGLATSFRWSTEEQRIATVGYPFPHCEVKLANDRGQTVAIGEQGEICIRGWPVFKQYFNDEELTANAKDINKNGWYHYGDICTMDETGHVTYIGRKSDCVRFKHYSDTVYPTKILAAIQKNEKIQNAKVIGIQSDDRGDDICLCVEPKPGFTVTEEELREAINCELLENMRPDYYFIFDQFPRTGARRKIAANQLKEMCIAKLATKRQIN